MSSNFIRNAHLEGDSFFWPAGKTGALLLHGYTATTAEVRLLGKYLFEQGYTVSGPLLPGHGTTPEDMNRCTWHDWANAVEVAYKQLAAQCDHVFICGESMGAVLSLYCATEHPEAAGVCIYAPALLVPPRTMFLARLLALFVPYTNKAEKKIPDATDPRWKGYSVNPLRAALQLNDLQKETRRRLPVIQQPMLVVQGRLDQTIDPRSGRIILDEISSPVKELHWFEHSTHCIILDQEWEQVAEMTFKFMERVIA